MVSVAPTAFHSPREPLNHAVAPDALLWQLPPLRSLRKRPPAFAHAPGAQERDLARYYHRCSEEAALEWPRTSAVLEQIAKSYEAEGTRQDEDAERREW